jgi:uncharacterized protein YdcH (DUF465 family)
VVAVFYWHNVVCHKIRRKEVFLDHLVRLFEEANLLGKIVTGDETSTTKNQNFKVHSLGNQKVLI